MKFFAQFSISFKCDKLVQQGWISNLHGATGLVLAYGKGMLHSLWTKSEVKIDVIPAEYVVNCILAAAWKTGVAHEQHRRLSMTSLSGMDEGIVLTYCFETKNFLQFFKYGMVKDC